MSKKVQESEEAFTGIVRFHHQVKVQGNPTKNIYKSSVSLLRKAQKKTKISTDLAKSEAKEENVASLLPLRANLHR